MKANNNSVGQWFIGFHCVLTLYREWKNFSGVVEVGFTSYDVNLFFDSILNKISTFTSTFDFIIHCNIEPKAHYDNCKSKEWNVSITFV